MAQYIEAKCAGCGAVSEIPAYNIINVKDHPELKEKVKDGSMFVWGCKNCGKVNLAAFQTLYHDPDESLMIWLMPDTLSDAEKQMIEQHMVAISTQLSSDENGELLKGYTLRRVKDAGSLIENVAGGSGNLSPGDSLFSGESADRDEWSGEGRFGAYCLG